MNNIFDSHAHYDSERFDEDREQILSDMNGAGVSNIINIGCDLQSSRNSIELADKYDFIYATVGFHPHDAKDFDEKASDEIKSMLSHKKVVAVGEIGLDYYYENSERDVQKEVFEKQLIIAKEFDKPVVIHSREATKDCLELLDKYRPRGVVHCYSSSAETAKILIKFGMYIGFTGVVTFPNAKKIIKAVDEIPVERILLETDCPYMAPVPHRGKRSDSTMIENTASKLAELKGLEVQQLIDIANSNTKALFGIG